MKSEYIGVHEVDNGQTHSNNSSAICRRIVWVCLTILWDWRLKGLSLVSGVFIIKSDYLSVIKLLTNFTPLAYFL